MTDDQIEVAARLYCKKMGRDPDSQHSSFEGYLMGRSVTYWKLIAVKVREADAMQQALKEAKKTP